MEHFLNYFEKIFFLKTQHDVNSGDTAFKFIIYVIRFYTII